MLGFNHPQMLFLLAAVSIPVLVHYLSKARAVVVRFPAYHLLLEAGGGRQALSRLRTILLLVLRCLFLLFFTFIFSKPYWRSSASQALSGQKQRAVVILDSSLSMSAGSNGATLFSLGAARAGEILRSLESGSEAGLIYAGDISKPALPALSTNLSRLYSTLSKAQPGQSQCRPAAALGAAAKMLGESGNVFIISDFQRTNWARADFSKYKNLNFILTPVSKSGVDNLGVTAVNVSPSNPSPGESVLLGCEVFNSSAREKPVKVAVDIAGQLMYRDIIIKPYSLASVHFDFIASPERRCSGKVFTASDNLPADNTRWFTLKSRKALRVLLAGDEIERRDSAAYYIGRALAPKGDSGAFLVQKSHGIDIGSDSIDGSDMFFIVPPLSASPEVLREIVRKVKNGASCIFFCAGEDARSALLSFATAEDSVAAPPFAVGDEVRFVQSGTSLRLSMRAAELMPSFGSVDNADFSKIVCRKYLGAKVTPERSSEVLMAYPEGNAGLTLTPVGKGKVVYFNIPVEPAAGNIAGSPLFPALIHDLVRLLRVSDDRSSVCTGSGSELYLHISSAEAKSVKVTGPSGIEVEFDFKSIGGGGYLVFDDLRRSGIYKVMNNSVVMHEFAVNVPAHETDTRHVNPELIAKSAAASVVSGDDATTVANVYELWPLSLLLAVVMLLAEMLITVIWRKRTPSQEVSK